MDWNEVARNFVFTPHSNWTLNWHLLLDQIKNLCELSRMMFDINLEGPRLLDVEHNHCADNRHPTNSNWQLSYGRAHLQVGNLKLYFELVATLLMLSKRDLHQVIGACSPLLTKKLNGRHFEVRPLGFTSFSSHSFQSCFSQRR